MILEIGVHKLNRELGRQGQAHCPCLPKSLFKLRAHISSFNFGIVEEMTAFPSREDIFRAAKESTKGSKPGHAHKMRQ